MTSFCNEIISSLPEIMAQKMNESQAVTHKRMPASIRLLPAPMKTVRITSVIRTITDLVCAHGHRSRETEPKSSLPEIEVCQFPNAHAPVRRQQMNLSNKPQPTFAEFLQRL